LSKVGKALCYDVQSGNIERHHDIIYSMVRAWLMEASLPKALWFKAFESGIYVKNRGINAFVKLDMTPYEKTYKTKPRVYECVVFAHIAKPNRNKMDDNAVRYIVVGYSYECTGYQLYVLEKGTCLTASSVDFVQGVFSWKGHGR